jgi:hypothetical protein
MILLLFVSTLGQAGVKRLHPTMRRIRRHKQCLRSFAPLNKIDFNLCFAFTALPFLKSRRLHNSGLKSKPMYNRGKLHSHLLAASQSGTCPFSLPQAVPQSVCSEPQSPGVIFLKEKQASEAPKVHRELSARSGRYSTCFIVTLGKAPIAQALGKKPLALVCVFDEPCFFRVARQPQQPVVQALKKI